VAVPAVAVLIVGAVAAWSAPQLWRGPGRPAAQVGSPSARPDDPAGGGGAPAPTTGSAPGPAAASPTVGSAAATASAAGPRATSTARGASPRTGPTAPTRSAAGAGVPGGSPARPIGVADPGLISATDAAQTSQIAAMKAVGITAVRLDARWDWVQYGGPASYDWNDLDRAVGNLRAAGLTVDLLVAGCPTWAAASDRSRSGACHPASAAQFGQWAGAVAGRFHPQGVRLYEIWNEPNQAASWGPSADAAAYAAILAAAYQAIKKVSADTVVLSGGLAPVTTEGGDVTGTTFLSSVYAHGGKGTFDAVGYHAYCYPALPDSFQSWSGWSQMAGTSPSLRSVMAANGDSGKQIWITEAGAPTAGPRGVGEQAQAQTISQAVAGAASASWVGGLFLYTWRDAGTDAGDSEDWFGLMTKAGASKPAMAALQRSIAGSWT